MQSRSGVVLVLVLAVSLIAFVTSAAAQSEFGLAFARSGPVSVSWEALGKGFSIGVCNGGDKDAVGIHALLEGLEFKEDGAEIAISDVLRAEAPATGIPAGDCRQVTLTRIRANVDPGSYMGTLAIAAPGVGGDEISLDVAGPGQAPIPATVNGAIEEASLSVENATPWSSAALGSGASLLLAQPHSGEEPLKIGQECQVPKDETSWDEGRCPFIGNLYQGENVIHVYVAGELIKEKGVERLPLRLSSTVHAVGTYEGRLDPSLSGDKEHMVKTKLTATDGWWCAFVALLLGAGIALAIQVWSGRWRPKRLLELRREGLVGAYEEARKALGEISAVDVELDHEAIGRYSQEVESAIKRYASSVLLVDTTSDVYKEIVDSLTLAEADAKLLGDEKKGFAASLKALHDEAAATTSLLANTSLRGDKPKLLVLAEVPFAGGSFGVGDATKRSSKADELTSLLDKWQKVAKRVFVCESWLFELGRKAEKAHPYVMEDEDKKTLAETAMLLRQVHDELFGVTSEEDLERLRISGRLEAVFGKLSYLGAKYEVSEPKQLQIGSQEGVFDKVRLAFSSILATDSAGEVEPVPREAPTLVTTAEASAVRLPGARLRLLVGDVAAMLAGVVIAICTGLSLVYFGKTFGTFEDYITVVVIGSAAQTIVKAILGNLETFAHDIAPLAEAKLPVAAIVPATG